MSLVHGELIEQQAYVPGPHRFRLLAQLCRALHDNGREAREPCCAQPRLDVLLSALAHRGNLVALLSADGQYVAEAGLEEDHVRATVSLDVHVYDVPFALQLMVDSVVAQNIPFIEHLFGDTEQAQLAASPIAFVDGNVPPAMLVSVQPSPDDVGSHGYIVSQAAERYAQALRDAGHVAETLHDSDETHTTLATGFGADGDLVTEGVGAFLDALQ